MFYERYSITSRVKAFLHQVAERGYCDAAGSDAEPDSASERSEGDLDPDLDYGIEDADDLELRDADTGSAVDSASEDPSNPSEYLLLDDPMEAPIEDIRKDTEMATSAPAHAPAEQPRAKDVGPTEVVGAFMTRSPACLNKDMTLLEAIRVLLRHNISGAPVVEPYEGDSEGSGRLIGVLSEEDLLWKEVEASEQSLAETFREPYLWSLMASDSNMMEAVENQAMKVLSNTVGLSMSEMSISVSPDTTMREAASIMLDAKVKRLPVVAPRAEGRQGMTVVGIITRKDVLRHVMGVLEASSSAATAGTRTDQGEEEKGG